MFRVSAILCIALGALLSGSFSKVLRDKRSIDLSATQPIFMEMRLSKDFIPSIVVLDLRPDFEEGTFNGTLRMNLTSYEDVNKLSFHAHTDLDIDEKSVYVKKISLPKEKDRPNLTYFPISRCFRMPKKPIYILSLPETIPQGSEFEIFLTYTGKIWDNTEALFKGTYPDEKGDTKEFLATYMRPHNARRVFPCFDEPGFKPIYNVSISRPKTHVTLFNTPVERTEPLPDWEDYVVDYFVPTPPMSTFTFGFVISQLAPLNISKEYCESDDNCPNIRFWTRPEISHKFTGVFKKVVTVYNYFEKYFKAQLPIRKLDVVALPGLATLRPADNWGLLVFKETELMDCGYYQVAHEIVYQWLGSFVTPYWWTDAHINKAVNSFLASDAVIEIDNGKELNGKYPMTVLYSIYYEFSKRYPHSKITAMKQETTSFKTELVIRMLNYTLSSHTFKTGIQNFIANRQFGTFFGDDLWDALTKQAHLDNTLDKEFTVNEIAGSWITKDRLPVIKVQRNYRDHTAKVQQKLYLRERPHDVPEQDKMIWWIPLVLVGQDDLNFQNTTPYAWMENAREVILNDMPDETKFIIINPEEIGPFPVNYDERNWNMLAKYLQTEEGRTIVPTYTRAKLLHDAWNIAYAGDLSFAVAFDMTLFMKYERDHIVWNPVFTFIDHIGRHIDMTTGVHSKFETYVRVLLTPLYEELGEPTPNEENWKNDLRSLARTFLCRSGYKPCIQEAQNAFKTWMEANDTDAETLVPNLYICPVFKWGTMEEWEFGLERVINFPRSRVQSERTRLLKSLVTCPAQHEKIERLLNITVLEGQANFTENDVTLILNLLTKSSNGYISLFKFLENNWAVLREKFANNSNVWDSLIGSATGVFTTQEGYEMVKKLKQDHKNEFGSAEHIIDKSLRNIKEEAKWSAENLPVIEKWLDNFLKTTDQGDG